MKFDEILSIEEDFLLSSYSRDTKKSTNFKYTSQVVINAFTEKDDKGLDLCKFCIENDVEDEKLTRYKNEKHFHIRAFMQHIESRVLTSIRYF
jgi:hypothetical protein